MVIGELPGVLDISHASVFVADDEVELAVLVPIERDGGDHLEVHGQRTRRTRQGFGFERSLPSRRTCAGGHARRHGQPASGGILGLSPRSYILEIGEAVQELSAKEIQIPVAVEVREIRRGPAEDLKILAGGLDADGRLILGLLVSALVPHEIHEATQRAFDPYAFLIVGVVPAVVGPITDADDHVGLPIAVIVDDLPHVRPYFVGVYVRREGQLLA